MDRLLGVLDAQLGVNEYVAGPHYSIADMIIWSWAFLAARLLDDSVWETFPHVRRWVNQVAERPAVQKGRKAGEELGKEERTPEQEEARRKILFNQTNDKVRAAREEAARSV